MYYKQCTLQRSSPNRTTETIAFIPEKYAKLGKILKINNVDGWKVVSVGSLRIADEDLHDREYKHHREVTDI